MARTDRFDLRNEEIKHQFRLQVRTELDELISVLKWFENSTQFLLPDTTIWQAKVALAEGFTNTVRHAHQGLPKETPIHLEIAIFDNYLEMKIWDRGKPFDVHKKLEELQKSEKDSLLKENDRGLVFMQSLTDELYYIHLSHQQNCLVMRKVISP